MPRYTGYHTISNGWSARSNPQHRLHQVASSWVAHAKPFLQARMVSAQEKHGRLVSNSLRAGRKHSAHQLSLCKQITTEPQSSPSKASRALQALVFEGAGQQRPSTPTGLSHLRVYHNTADSFVSFVRFSLPIDTFIASQVINSPLPLPPEFQSRFHSQISKLKFLPHTASIHVCFTIPSVPQGLLDRGGDSVEVM